MILTCDNRQVIDTFDGKNRFLSNFYPVIIHSSGLLFPSVEHAYQASKTNDISAWNLIASIPAEQAGKAKRIGKKVKLRKDWDLIKLSVMRRFLKEKFMCSDLREKLISTGSALLVEGNYWHDNFWGDCHCKKCKNVKGLNNLGILLMEVRRQIIESSNNR